MLSELTAIRACEPAAAMLPASFGLELFETALIQPSPQYRRVIIMNQWSANARRARPNQRLRAFKKTAQE
jgi:hypothetical protein